MNGNGNVEELMGTHVRTLILGLGNPLRGDDGVGAAAISWLQARGLPPGVVALDGGTSGLELVLAMAGYDRVIIVDAADLHRAPGAWIRFRPDMTRLSEVEPLLSMHDAGLPEALALAASLDALPAELVIFGVQPAQLDWSPGLSGPVQAAVPAVGEEVRRCAQDNGDGDDRIGIAALAGMGFVHDHDHGGDERWRES
jgi:hydrogenase maturation protease